MHRWHSKVDTSDAKGRPLPSEGPPLCPIIELGDTMYFDPIIDENDMEVECDIHLCDRTATMQDDFDENFCPDHLEEAYLELEADRQVKLAKEWW